MSNIENKVYKYEGHKIEQIKKDMKTLSKFSKLNTIEIEFDVAGKQEKFLELQFLKSGVGFYVQNTLYLQIFNQDLNPINELLDIIDMNIITQHEVEAVVIMCEVQFNNKEVEVALQLSGNKNSPKLLSVSNMYHFFDISHLIQSQWYFQSQTS